MKLAFFSDLHADYNQDETNIDILFYLIEHVKKIQPNYVVIAGDLSNGADVTIRYLERIEQEAGIPVLYVPGNHDMWNEVSSFTEEYQKLKEHHTSLIENPRLLNKDWIIIGDLGWYDYSFRDESMYSIDQCVEYKADYWSGDYHYVQTDKTDPEICDLFLKKFQKLLEEHKNKQVIFVNHFVPYEKFLIYKHNNFIWNFNNAYVGTKKLGKLLDKYKNIKYVVFGHTHKRHGLVKTKTKSIICTPFGYAHDWTTQNMQQEIESSCVVIEI